MKLPPKAGEYSLITREVFPKEEEKKGREGRLEEEKETGPAKAV